MSAFLFLIWASGRNRVLSSLRRARRPRYAIALAVGALYIWAFLVRPATGPGVTSIFVGPGTEAVVTLLVVLMLMNSWVFGSDTMALAFSQAEVSFLFPAPLSRRALIRYKLVRAQILVLVNALIWVLVLRRGGGTLPMVLRAASLWVLFSTLNLHRLGAALVRSSWVAHGSAGARRHRWSIVCFALVAVGVATSLVAHRSALAHPGGFGAFFSSLGDALSTAPASWALLPFHAVVAPTFAASAGEWWREILPAAVVLAAHGWWVMWTDANFEDAAIEASATRARRLDAIRSKRAITSAPRAAGTAPALAASGPPGMAIFWKNMLCLRRTAKLRLLIGPTAIAISLGVAFSSDGSTPAAVVTRTAMLLAAMLVLFGGRLIRNDLRQDMQHLALLKSLPVSPGAVMVAEVASSALPMAAIQFVLVLVAFAAATFWPTAPLTPSFRLGILVAAPFATLAVNGALLTIQNGIAVLFPAWIRLGPTVTTGVEALGQNVLGTAANLVLLGLALVVPGLAAITLLTTLGESDALALVVATIVGSAILAAETYVVLRILGRAFAKAEPDQ